MIPNLVVPNSPSPYPQTTIQCTPLNQLILNNGIFDENENIKPEFEIKATTILKEAQLQRLDSLLHTPLKIKVKSVEFFICLKDLFLFLGKETIEIIGGTVYWILGKECAIEIIKALKLDPHKCSQNLFEEFEKPAADIDIRILLDQKDNPALFREKILLFFQTKAPFLSLEQIEQSGFTKLYTQAGDDAVFSIAGFGNEDIAIDLLFVKQLQRNYLFEHDAIKIVVSYLGRQFRTNEIKSASGTIMKPLYYRISKILSAKKAEEIDLSGACRLFSYLAKGWTYSSNELERALVSKIYGSEEFCNKLNKTARNHFPKDSSAPFVLFFYACLFLPDGQQKRYIPLIQEAVLKLKTENSEHITSLAFFIESFKKMLQFPNYQEAFTIFKACLQIFVGLRFAFQEKETKKDFLVTAVTLKDEPHLRLQLTHLSSLYITLKIDLNQALSFLERADRVIKEALFPLFFCPTNFFCFYKKINALSSPIIDEGEPIPLKTIFNFLESENPCLKEGGFYLLCYVGIKEKTKTHLPLLFKKLPKVMGSASFFAKKNILSCFLKYWQTLFYEEFLLVLPQIETLYQLIDEKKLDGKELADNIYSFFCKADSFSYLILSPYEEKKVLLNEEGVLSLITIFLPKSIPHALKLLVLLLEKTPHTKQSKQLFDRLVTEYWKEKNKLLLERDFVQFVKIAEKILEEMPLFKGTPPLNEIQSILTVIERLLFIDYSKAIRCIKEIENKNLLSKPLVFILQKINPEKRALLLLKEEGPPNSAEIEFKLAINTLKELNKTSSCYQEMNLKLTKYLKRIFFSEKPVPKPIASLVRDNLEFLFFKLLQNSQELEGSISLYFQIHDTLAPQTPLKEEQFVLFLKTLREFLIQEENKKKALSFVLEQKLTRKIDKKKIFPEEIALYLTIFQTAEELQSFDIALDYLNKIFSLESNKKKIASNETSESFLHMIDCLIKNKRALDALSLFYSFKNLFSNTPLLREKEILKTFILTLTESAPVRAWKILSDKCALFIDDKEVEEKAKELLMAFLHSFSSIEKKQAFFHIAAVIIKTYKLNDEHLINCLKEPLLSMEDKQITLLLFSLFEKMHTPYGRLIPFFELLISQSPESYQKFLKKPTLILEAASLEEDRDKKCSFLYIIALGFLKLAKEPKSPLQDIYVGVKCLEDEIRATLFMDTLNQMISPDLSTFYRMDDDFDQFSLEFVRVFHSFDHLEAMIDVFDNLNYLGKILTNESKKNHLNPQELLGFLAKAISIFSKYKKDENPLDRVRNLIYYCNQEMESANIQKCQEFYLPFLEAVPEFSSNKAIEVAFLFCSYTLLRVQALTSHSKKKFIPLPRFKKALVNNIFASFKHGSYNVLVFELMDPHFFNGTEKISLLEECTLTFFNHNKKYLEDSILTTKEKKKLISDSLALYASGLELPIQNSNLVKSNCQASIAALLALSFLDITGEEYFSELNKVVKPLLAQSKKVIPLDKILKHPAIHNELLHYFHIPCKEETEKEIADKIYRFFAEYISITINVFFETLIRAPKNLIPPLDLKMILSHVSHLHYLSFFIPVRSDFIELCLGYCLLLIRLDETSFKQAFPCIKKLCHEIFIKRNTFFIDNVNTQNFITFAIFAHFPLNQFPISDTPNKTAIYILELVKDILKIDTLLAFRIGYCYLHHYAETLGSQGNLIQGVSFGIITNLEKKFPEIKDPKAYLEASRQELFPDLTADSLLEEQRDFQIQFCILEG